jgi:hypothetical protein
MKNILRLTAMLGAACALSPSAQAQTRGFSGENSFSLEGGLSTALNHSKASLVVANNAGAGAPWATTELVSANVLDFGLGASFGLQADFGLNSGRSVYFRSSGNWAKGSVDISGLFSVSGAIPGIHDDGKLLKNTWSPVATVSTQTLDVAVGFQTTPHNGIRYFGGAIHGRVSQDLNVDYVINALLPSRFDISINGRAANLMYGAELGASYSRALSDKLDIVLTGTLAALDNTFTYTYQYENINQSGIIVSNTYTAAGSSVVLRSEVSAQLVYAKSETLSLTGKIGVVNYGNVSTGLENTLNPNNTTATITPVFGSVIVPYIRAGISIAF